MQNFRNWTKQWVVVLFAAVCLVGATSVSVVHAGERVTEGRGGYNDEYIYAATRGLADANMHPALKVTLVPVTLVLDTAFLPFALIMGFFH